MMPTRLRRDDMESAMAWLSLLLFLPWFLLLGSLYWLFPRQPRTARRRLFDGTTLLLAFALSIVSMLWGHRIGVEQTGARSEEHTSELQSQSNLVCRLLLEKTTSGTPSRAAACAS